MDILLGISALFLMVTMALLITWGASQLFDLFESESLAKKTRDKEKYVEAGQPIIQTTGIQQKYNKSAIVGIVLSVVSIFGLGLAGLAGFILGIVALVQIKHTKEKGRGIAIAAIIIGFIWSFVIGILRRLIEAGF